MRTYGSKLPIEILALYERFADIDKVISIGSFAPSAGATSPDTLYYVFDYDKKPYVLVQTDYAEPVGDAWEFDHEQDEYRVASMLLPKRDEEALERIGMDPNFLRDGVLIIPSQHPSSFYFYVFELEKTNKE